MLHYEGGREEGGGVGGGGAGREAQRLVNYNKCRRRHSVSEPLFSLFWVCCSVSH